MRKLKLQVQLSLDSYIAGPDGEMDWMVRNWDDKLKKYVFELTDSVETIILGRKMTDGFVSYWSDLMNKPDDPFYGPRTYATGPYDDGYNTAKFDFLHHKSYSDSCHTDCTGYKLGYSEAWNR